VAGTLRLSYAQFQEMELFTRFGTQLDSHTRQLLERGRRIRQALQQPLHRPLAVPVQVALLHAVGRGLLDEVPEDSIGLIEGRLGVELPRSEPALCASIEQGEAFGEAERDRLDALIRRLLEQLAEEASAH
jgi:F-type H+-transporting ATPase subunit alpha